MRQQQHLKRVRLNETGNPLWSGQQFAPSDLTLLTAPGIPEIRLEPILAEPPGTAPETNYERTASVFPSARTRLSSPYARLLQNRRPWLALGSCLILGCVGGWIWWQLRPLPSPEDPSASAPPRTSRSRVSASAPTVVTPAKRSHTPPRDKATQHHLATNQSNIQRHETEVPPQLETAWMALQQGDLVMAEPLYQRILAINPRNRDALLGLAFIATRQGNKPEAVLYYQRLLALYPHDDAALTGLLILEPERISEKIETRLLLQLGNDQTPLALAQYYAAHQRWHEAQEQYFRAYTQTPGNADLAFNLAISLDHIRQSGLAAAYYRKALAQESGSFNRTAAKQRITELTEGAR